jgi:uncharacterized protein YqeY
MGLRDQLSGAMKDAMKSRDTKRLSAIRLMLAAIQSQGIATRNENLSDAEIVDVLARMIKQREDSAAQYEQAVVPELAAGERDEIVVIREFMPRQMSPEETRAAVAEAIAASGATAMKGHGQGDGRAEGTPCRQHGLRQSQCFGQRAVATPKA